MQNEAEYGISPEPRTQENQYHHDHCLFRIAFLSYNILDEERIRLHESLMKNI